MKTVIELVEQVAKIGRLPVPNFSAGGIATPADASLVMQLGAESVFVGSGIFKSEDQGESWGEWFDQASGLENILINDLLVSPKEESTVYAATQGGLFFFLRGGRPLGTS